MLKIGLNIEVQKHETSNATAVQTLLNIFIDAKTKQAQIDRFCNIIRGIFQLIKNGSS